MSWPSLVLAVFVFFGAVDAACAVPDLSKGIEAGPLKVYPDDRRSNRFYYPPGDLVFAVDAEGKPDLEFFQMVYSGTAVSGDRGVIVHRNILSLGVEMMGPSSEDVRATRRALRRPGLDLRPLPIERLEAALVYIVPGSEEKNLPKGHFESEGDASRTGFWTERSYNLRLDNQSAQLFWEAMHTGRAVISIAYGFAVQGLPSDEPFEELLGSPKLVEAVKKQLGEAKPSVADGDGEEGPKTVSVLVKAGASSLDVDAERWPQLFRKVVFDGNVPPGYALLEVRCYDFRNETRPDLYERRLEIDAEGVAGKRVRLATTFGSDDPDLYARSLRFPFAVRLDRPYRYRVTDLTLEGEENLSEWREAESWSRMLDITSKVASLADFRKSLEDPDDETN